MIDYSRIKSISAERGVLDIVIEKDYVLDWALWGISNDNFLKNNIIFKGGTALHKVYFPDWRFSEDLDFTSIQNIDLISLKESILNLCNEVTKKSGIGLNLKNIRPSGSLNENWSYEISIEYTGPRGQTRDNLPMILFHITYDEPILYEPQKKFISKPYEDVPADFVILTYPIEEILAEKLRTVLYQRCYPRDVYDLWRLLNEVMFYIDLERLIPAYEKKCHHRGITLAGLPFNINERIQRLKKHWEKGLQRQIPNPPKFDVVCQELMEKLNLLFSKYKILVKGGTRMIESVYVLRYKKGDMEIEVQGDKAFVEEKFKELLKLEIKSTLEQGLSDEKKEIKYDKEISLVEFLNQKNPKSHGDKILIFGYYLERIKGYEAFNIDDIEKCYQDARIPKTKNFSLYITRLIRQGYLMDSDQKKDNKKAWLLTKNGREYVEKYGENVG